MSTDHDSKASKGVEFNLLLMNLKSIQTRLDKIESEKTKNSFRRLSENAGAVGLILGLILAFASLYDVFVKKPEADRISAISQFNQAVSSAAKTRQELIQQFQTGDDKTHLYIMSLATPRILNDVATAKALLPTLDDKDVGIPQLLILIQESTTAGDSTSAAHFVDRAVHKKDESPFMHSEAKRYEGKFLYYSGKPLEGRQAFEEAIKSIDSPLYSAAQAFDLSDLIATEYAAGDCSHVEGDIRDLSNLLSSQSVSMDVHMQVVGAVQSQLEGFKGKKCPVPSNLTLLAAR